MAFDVFVSYASKDKIVADAACARLESAGIRCWIAPRDIVAGTSYGEAIIEAIHAAKVMVLIFSANANLSAHIPKEVERAVSNGVAIIPFRIEDVAPGKSLDYFIGSVHWLDAMTPPMEKHLDDLATTVHKLLPVKTGEQGVRQQGSPPMTEVRTANRDETARASSSKTVWIGVAALVVLAAIVTGVMLIRSGGNSQNTANVPGAGPALHASDPPGESAPKPKSVAQPVSPGVKSSADAIVGCYQWFNNVPAVISADGTVAAGGFTGHWRRVSASRRAYTITWPEATDTVTISPDQRALSGKNQYGFSTSGTRISGRSGLAGTWRWPNGVPLTVYPNGAFSAATFQGKWRAVNASSGIYALTWPNPVDSVTLLADGAHISGANQYGIAISGVKTGPCAGN